MEQDSGPWGGRSSMKLVTVKSLPHAEFIGGKVGGSGDGGGDGLGGGLGFMRFKKIIGGGDGGIVGGGGDGGDGGDGEAGGSRPSTKPGEAPV